MLPNTEPTIAEHVSSLVPRMSRKRFRQLPAWPPDAFALCLSLLQSSAVYCTVLKNWPPTTNVGSIAWDEYIADIGRLWRSAWVDERKPPADMIRLWTIVKRSFSDPVSSIRTSLALSQALLQICAAADEACVAVGTPGELEIDEEDDDRYYDLKFREQADRLLERQDDGASLCEEIHPSRARVLPKQHTPQSGLTSRSLSLYIGLSLAREVKPVWIQPAGVYKGDVSFNLLLVPWPFEIKRTQFGPKKPLSSEMGNMPSEFGFFTVKHGDASESIPEVICEFYDRAEREFGKIGAVVLPEASISSAEFDALSKVLASRGSQCLLIAGVAENGADGSTHDQNTVCLQIPSYEKTVVQHKHHRWKLTPPQLIQYNLGGVLNPSRDWWEHIDISDRTLTFVSLLSTFTLSVLICEDLARPDPVADVVRVVGPNLVIALLMDGPQLKERWPSRHAVTLADDPGCSVLALTSLGMSLLSKPADANTLDRSRTIAIWKDPLESTPREISLPPDHGAVVLSVSIRDSIEWSADGRSTNSGVPKLTGVYPLPGSRPKFPARGATTTLYDDTP